MTTYREAGTTTAYDIADSFLRKLGATPTPALRRAVAIWLSQEGRTVRGNNPWNLHHGNACKSESGFCAGTDPGFNAAYVGNRFAGTGDQNVAVFSSLSAGAAANASNLIRLSGSGYGYDKVINEARTGDARGFLTALQSSSWSAGHYGGNKLTNAFDSGGGSNYAVKLLQPVQAGGTYTGKDESVLGAWSNLINFPVGHALTSQDVDSIMQTLQNNGYFQGDSVLGGSATKTREILTSHIGDVWSKNLQDQLQAEFFGAASTAVDPVTAVANAVQGVGNQLADTATWIGFILLGLVLIIGGIYLLGGSSKENA